MKHPFASLKLTLHRELVRHPELHGWTLNLYRSGEDYPQQVDDYFPIEFAPNAAIADAMTSHLGDERRHEAMFRGALASIGEPIVDYRGYDIYNECVRAHTSESFKIDATDASETRIYKLANFFCHAHFLEKRVAQSLSYHGEACEMEQRKIAAGVISRVLLDESRHVSLTAELARELLPSRVAGEVFKRHSEAEKRANVMFSKRQLRHSLAGLAQSAKLPRRLALMPLTFLLGSGTHHHA